MSDSSVTQSMQHEGLSVKDVVFIERKWIDQHLSEIVKRLCKLGIDLVKTAKT